jgi:antitoxin (DNA-binding transcriptional repressor) of toxin-antitoxin stability system
LTTTTAKKLRENLSEYLDRLQHGEEIFIIRHSEVIGVLKPAKMLRTNSGSSVATMFNRNRKFFESNKGKVSDAIDAKEIYHQALDERPRK